MANKILIRRSLANATVTGLSNGELAFTSNGDTLHIGSPNGSIIAIGGLRTPGTLTANQALVANSTSGIDKVIVANLVPTSVWANGAAGSGGQVLTSNATGGVYWSTPSATVAGSDTQVQFNDGGTLAGDTGFTFNKTTDTLTVGNTEVTGRANAGSFTVGTAFTANSTLVNAAAINVVNQVNTATLFVTTSANVGTAFTVNSTTVNVGTAVGLRANGTIGTAGQQLYSNGTTIYWADPSGDITGVTAGSGLTGGGTSGAVTLDVGAGNGITVAADSVSVDGANGISVDASGVNVLAGTSGGLSVNATGVWVVAGSGLVTNATGLHVGTANGITVTADAVGVLTGSTLTVNATGVHVNSTLSITDLTLAGNLTINGTLTTVDTTNLTVKDSMIELANGNGTTDSLDIGFYGQYGATGTKFTGLFRDATDGVFKLFTGSQEEPTTTVNTTATGYTLATLNSYLTSGGLVSNATNIAITANSTLAVAIVANTLSLSTALPATSGGTGFATYTSGEILVANTGNILSKLSLGADGKVLQSNGTALVYDDLDGGTF